MSLEGSDVTRDAASSCDGVRSRSRAILRACRATSGTRASCACVAAIRSGWIPAFGFCVLVTIEGTFALLSSTSDVAS